MNNQNDDKKLEALEEVNAEGTDKVEEASKQDETTEEPQEETVALEEEPKEEEEKLPLPYQCLQH